MTTDKPTALGRLRAQNGRAQPYKVAMLGLGNEAWGCGGSMTAADYVQQMRRLRRRLEAEDSRSRSGGRAATASRIPAHRIRL